MALLNKLKSILGIGGGRDGEDQRTDTSVTVEREASEPASEDTTAAPTPESESIDEDDAVAAGTDATASTGSMTESAADEPETAAEPSEAAAPPSDSDDEDDGNVEDVIDQAEPSTDSEDAVAAGTDATASTDSLVDEQTDPDEAAEASEATGPPIGSVDDAESVDESEKPVDEDVTPADDSEESVDDHDEPESEPDEPVETIKGIGPAYSDRLGDAGIESVSALAAADAEEVGEAIDVSPKIVADWIDRAEDQ